MPRIFFSILPQIPASVNAGAENAAAVHNATAGIRTHVPNTASWTSLPPTFIAKYRSNIPPQLPSEKMLKSRPGAFSES